ncbi:MAG: L-lactate dehydrogenase, partial [Sphingomonadales bacterium]
AWIYALAGGGEAGVRHVLQRLEAELRTAMILTGNRDIAGIGRDTLAR